MKIRPSHTLNLFAAIAFAIVTASTIAQVPSQPTASSKTTSIESSEPQSMTLTSLTSDEMTLLIKDMPPQMRSELASSAEARKEFAEHLKQVLSLAAEASAAGFGDSSETKEQLDLMRSLIVAEFYEKKQAAARGPSPAFADIKEDEVRAFLGEPGQEEKFTRFLMIARTMGLLGDKELPEEQLMQLKNEWGRVFISESKAVKAGFDHQRNVQLHIAFQQARFLAQQYGKDKLEPQIIATDVDIDAYIVAHPELDDSKLRARAEMVLRRARRGENFAALAKEFSTDQGNKDKGGDLDWFGRGVMVKEFEDAALKLRPGQISNVVQTVFGFHIIKVEGRRRRKNSAGKFELQVHASHILFSSMTERDNLMMTPKSGREKARDAVLRDTRERLVGEITKRHEITVAEDFVVEAPPEKK